MRLGGVAFAVLLLGGCDRQGSEAVEPVTPPTEESANRLMGLAEQAAADMENESTAERSTSRNLIEGER